MRCEHTIGDHSAPISEMAGPHVAPMGGLGLGVLIVQSIALRHCGFPLGLSRLARLSLLFLIIAVTLRVAPDLGLFDSPSSPHALASVILGTAFLLWLRTYWPLLSNPATIGTNRW